MYRNYYYQDRLNPYHVGIPCFQQPYYPMYYSTHNSFMDRQQPISGQATWTEGGQVTQCGISWSENQYMTASVGTNTPYQCGQILKVKNTASPFQKEILVKVVDRVPGYPANKINLHRRAFLALGANLSQGVINVEITPSPDVEQEEWGKYLVEVTQAAYPNYNVTNYNFVSKTPIASNQTKQTYEFILKSPQEKIKVQGNVIYNPNTGRLISFDLKEL